MKYIYILKQIIIFILIAVIIGMIVMSIKNKPKVIEEEKTNEPVVEEQQTYNLCYYHSNKTKSNFYDVAWLRLNITGEKITGEFQNLPAERDSKVGKFEGIVGKVNQQSMSRQANVWWNSFAEGMNVKEELLINFGDGSATVGFGEMIDRGDGVYIYKNKDNLNYPYQMSQIDCETLDEKLFTEKYIRDNIATLATDKPALGGVWYVISAVINPIAHTGEIVYEDGHIQSKASIIYSYQKTPQSITVSKWEIK